MTVGNPAGGALQVVDLRTGQVRELVSAEASRPSLSPDRRSIIYLLTIGGPEREAHVIDIDGGGDRALFDSGPCARSTRPTWSPDGTRLAVICTRNSAEPTLWTSDPDGGSLRQVNLDVSTSGVDGRLAGSPTWAPYGDVLGIVLGIRASDSSIDLFWVNADDPSDVHQVTDTTGADYDPDWSPEAGKLLFQRNPDTPKSVGGSPQTIASLEDGGSPSALTPEDGFGSGSWSPDGSEVLLTRAQDGALMVVGSDGGEPQPVPDFSGPASSLAWSSR